MAIPEDHRLAAFDRIPRVEILKEPFLTWARSLNPPAIDGFHRSLLGMTEHPRSVEVADALVSSRLLMVAEGKGIAQIGRASCRERVESGGGGGAAREQ